MNFATVNQNRLVFVKRCLPQFSGLLLLLPSLLVHPTYATSGCFHLVTTVAWLSWTFSLYKIESTIRKLDPLTDVFPRRMWLVSGLLGSHPMNYFLFASALLMTFFRQTPLSLMLVFAAPIFVIFSLCWYAWLFARLRIYINDRLPGGDRVSSFVEYLITLSIVGPAIVCLMTSADVLEWWHLSLIPLGITVATTGCYTLQSKLASALINQQNKLLEAGADELFPV